MKLDNKTAVITGSASGMGKGEALAFAKVGAKVVIADMDYDGAKEVVEEIEASGGEALAVAVDITDTDDVQSMIDQTKEKFGKIDILVNNAGVFDEYETILDTDIDQWKALVDVNLTGVFQVSKAVLPDMIEQGSGSIINVASVAGLVAGKGGAAYTATKHGVIGLTKHMASEYAKEGVQVNAIAPGTIETPLIAEVKDDIPTDDIPASRFGQVEEVAELVMFLASGQANFVNGVTIPIDGGFTIQ